MGRQEVFRKGVEDTRMTDKKYGHPRFYTLLDEMADTHSRKNHDYAEQSDPLSNFREVAEATNLNPFQVLHVFVATKCSRIKQLTKKANLVVGESIKDSLLDLAVYCLLWIIHIEEYESRNTGEDRGHTKVV